MLVFPPTPLLTVDAAVHGRLTVPGETNVLDTHGANLEYFFRERMARQIGVGRVF